MILIHGGFMALNTANRSETVTGETTNCSFEAIYTYWQKLPKADNDIGTHQRVLQHLLTSYLPGLYFVYLPFKVLFARPVCS
jgi:hypothetical protein